MKNLRIYLKSMVAAGFVLAASLAPVRSLAADYLIYTNGPVPEFGGNVTSPSGDPMAYFAFAENGGQYFNGSVTELPLSPHGGNYILGAVGFGQNWGGVGTAFIVSNTNATHLPKNLSNYAGGELRFYLRSDRALQVEIQYDDGAGNNVPSSAVSVPSTGGSWQEISITLNAANFGAGVDYSKIRVPFLIKIPTNYSAPDTIFRLDYIRWIEPAATTPVMRPESTRVNPGKRRQFIVENVNNPNITRSPTNLGTLSTAVGNEFIITAGATLQTGSVQAEKNSLTDTSSVQVTNTNLNRTYGLLAAETFTSGITLGNDGALFPYADALGGTITLTNVTDDTREGTFSVRANVNVPDVAGFAGAAIEWTGTSSIDMNEFFDGSVRFWFKAPAALSGKVSMSVRSTNVTAGSEQKIWLQNYVTFDNTWRVVTIPVDRLAGLSPKSDLSRMKVLFNIAVSSQTSGSQTFYLDKVRWDTRTPGALVYLTLTPPGTSGQITVPKNLKMNFLARGFDSNNAEVDIWPTWSWALGNAGTLSRTQGDTVIFTAANAAATGRLMASVGGSPFQTIDITVTNVAFTQSFNVYSDSGAGGYLGVSSCCGGSLGLNEYTPPGAPEGTKVMRATYTLAGTDAYANWYVDEANGSRFLGYFSDGFLHFWVKTTKDLEISMRSANILPQFNTAKIRLSEYAVPLDGTWQEVWIALADFKTRSANQLDFNTMTSFFAISALQSQSGPATDQPFEVDDVKWYTASAHVPDPAKVYIGLKNKQNSSTGLVLTFDNEPNKRAVTYDQALAAMAFTFNRDTALAKKVLDVYKAKFDAAGGSFAGFHEEYDRDNVNTIRDYDRTAGPNGWIMLAAIHYRNATGSQIYDPMINGIGTWIRSLQAADGAIQFGYMGNPGTLATYKSTEHNFDVYAAFRAWAAISGNSVYDTEANEVYTWLTTSHLSGGAFNVAQNRFNVGEKSDGSANIDYALDLYSWAPLALNGYESVLDNVETLFRNTQTVDLTGFPITGFDFSGWPGDAPGMTFGQVPDKDAVWLEGTGQMVLAYLVAGNQAKATQYLSELDKAVFNTDNGGQGLAYSADVGTAYWYPGYMDSTHAAISSMAWYLFAKWGFNPLQPLPLFDVAVKNISNNAVASNITWNVNVPAKWTRASQYIQFRVQGIDTRPWGLQIYTDNTNPLFPPARYQDPTPAITSNADSDPAGLIMNLPGATTTQHKLLMAWRVMDSTSSTPAAVRPYDLGLGDGGNPEAYNWFYFVDKATPPIDNNGNGSLSDPIDGPGFINGADYITVKSSSGLHTVGEDFFPFFSPDYIYLEADFDPAAAQVNYKANIILEFFIE